jgi:hypothetical protein
LIPKTESELECYAIDGLQLSLTHATASLEGVDYVVNATVSVNPMALARRFAAASKLETPTRAFLERWQLEARVTRIKPLNQPALGLPSLAVQYSHPLGPSPGDGTRTHTTRHTRNRTRTPHTLIVVIWQAGACRGWS